MGERFTPGQLAAILGTIGHGITAQGPDGALVYANDAAARLCGLESSEELLGLTVPEVLERFEIIGEDGAPLPSERLPNRLALETGEAQEGVVGYRLKPSGEDRWSVLRSTPLLSPEGDVRPRGQRLPGRHGGAQCRGAHSLPRRGEHDPLRFARRRGDARRACARCSSRAWPTTASSISLSEDDASLRQVVISHREPDREQLLRELRHRYPPEANDSIRSPRSAERRAAPDPGRPRRRARRGGGGRGAPPAVRVARGALVHRRPAGDARQAARDDLARHGRVASALRHVRSRPRPRDRAPCGARDRQRTALQCRAGVVRAADTLLLSAPVGIGFWDRDLRFVRVNDALAEINRLDSGGARRPDPRRAAAAPRADGSSRSTASVLETGEPVVHTESTDDAGRADRRPAALALELLPGAHARAAA